MAGDRHGKHNTTTISFRVNSYEKATIEERVKVSDICGRTGNRRVRTLYPTSTSNRCVEMHLYGRYCGS